MLIDCDRCPVQHRACGSCVLTLLLDRPAPDELEGLVGTERRALHALATAGLIGWDHALLAGGGLATAVRAS